MIYLFERSKKQVQRTKLYAGDFVRIVKKDEAFRKGYKQSFPHKIF